MSHRWIVKCKRCGADITVKIVDDQHTRVMAEPPKPVMMRQELQCALCGNRADYERQDLTFR